MGNGYPRVASDDIGALRDALREAFRRLRELEGATGTQTYGAVAKVKEAIDNIGSLVDSYLVSGFTTGSMTATGNVSVGGALHSTGRGTFDGGVTSADVKSRTLSVGYDSVYIDSNNIMGKSPSARRFKQDITDHDFDPDIVDKMQGHWFRLIAAVEQLGDAAPFEIGYIADELAEIGAEAFVRYDDDGQISGLAYERIVIVAIDALKDARRQIAETKAEIAQIKAHLGI